MVRRCYGHRFANGDVYMLWRSVTNWLMKSIVGIDMFHACKLVALPVPACPLAFVKGISFLQFLKCFTEIAVKITYFSNLFIFLLFSFWKWSFWLSLEYIIFRCMRCTACIWLSVEFGWRDTQTVDRSINCNSLYSVVYWMRLSFVPIHKCHVNFARDFAYQWHSFDSQQ